MPWGMEYLASSPVEESGGGFFDTLVNIGGTVVDWAGDNIFTKENVAGWMSQIRAGQQSTPATNQTSAKDFFGTIQTAFGNLTSAITNTDKITGFFTSPMGIIIVLGMIGIIVTLFLVF